jgi:hypothetical protein
VGWTTRSALCEPELACSSGTASARRCEEMARLPELRRVSTIECSIRQRRDDLQARCNATERVPEDGWGRAVTASISTASGFIDATQPKPRDLSKRPRRSNARSFERQLPQPQVSGDRQAAGDAKNLASIGERLLCQQQAQAWRDGLALVNFAKATVVGDILNESLPQGRMGLQEWPAGLFAKVAFPQTTDPKQSSRSARQRVALDVAIAAISSVPIVGQILGAVVQVARFPVSHLHDAERG